MRAEEVFWCIGRAGLDPEIAAALSELLQNGCWRDEIMRSAA
jgi:hypothetical protein